jgi:hypothetical protein
MSFNVTKRHFSLPFLRKGSRGLGTKSPKGNAKHCKKIVESKIYARMRSVRTHIFCGLLQQINPKNKKIVCKNFSKGYSISITKNDKLEQQVKYMHECEAFGRIYFTDYYGKTSLRTKRQQKRKHLEKCFLNFLPIKF